MSTRLPIQGMYLIICTYLGFKLILYSFGVAAVLLELVPVASILFAFTNTVGAALWAADMEKGNVTADGTAPQLREKAKKAE